MKFMFDGSKHNILKMVQHHRIKLVKMFFLV